MKNTNKYIDIDFDKLIEVFNNEGKEAAKTFVETTYGASYEIVQRRIKNETNYFFNRNTRKYKKRENIETNFMTIDELYTGSPRPSDNIESSIENEPIEDSFKELMINLMKDKMQEINKFIYLEQSTKRAIIDLKKLEKNGYKVVIN